MGFLKIGITTQEGNCAWITSLLYISFCHFSMVFLYLLCHFSNEFVSRSHFCLFFTQLNQIVSFIWVKNDKCNPSNCYKCKCNSTYFYNDFCFHNSVSSITVRINKMEQQTEKPITTTEKTCSAINKLNTWTSPSRLPSLGIPQSSVS